MHAGTKSVEVEYERDGKDYTVVLEPKQNEGDAFPLLGITGGEMVRPALEAAKLLEKDGIHATVVDMYCVKPLDKEAIVKAASNAKVVVTAEEHSPFGGLGSMVSQVVGAECPRKVVNIALPDAPVITGTSQEVFDYYGMNAEGIAKTVKDALK